MATPRWNPYKEYRVEVVKDGRTRVLGVFYVTVDNIRQALEGKMHGGTINVYHKTGKVVVDSFNG